LERVYGWKTYLVEPTSYQYELCKKYRKRAIVDRYAFISEELFKTNKNIDIQINGLMSKIESLESGHIEIPQAVERVPTNTLDQYFKTNNITSIDIFILDVEGFEIEVLEGYKANTGIINYLLVEAWDHENFYEYASNRGWGYIKKIGNDYLYELSK